MAAVAGEIDIEHLAKVNLDLTSSSWDDTIFQEVLEKLPSYARPVFLRRVSSLDITGTYKLKKRELQSEGCDPNKISDPLFLLHPQTRYPLLSDSPSLSCSFLLGSMCLWTAVSTRRLKKARSGCESSFILQRLPCGLEDHEGPCKSLLGGHHKGIQWPKRNHAEQTFCLHSIFVENQILANNAVISP